MDSDDLDFIQIMAGAMDLSDADYETFFETVQAELDADDIIEEDFSPYDLDGDWPDDYYMDAGAWYEVSGEYTEAD